MIKIKLTEDAHLEGYEGGFYRYTTEDGAPAAQGIANNWYEAPAVDTDGNEYRVVWEITELAAFESGDEDCCDWGNPAEIINLETGLPVLAKIEWK